MKVGDRIRVFEVLKDGAEYYGNHLLRKQASEVNGEFYGHDSCVDLYLKCPNTNENIHAGIDPIRKHAKHVCTMVIKSIKNEKQ